MQYTCNLYWQCHGRKFWFVLPQIQGQDRVNAINRNRDKVVLAGKVKHAIEITTQSCCATSYARPFLRIEPEVLAFTNRNITNPKNLNQIARWKSSPRPFDFGQSPLPTGPSCHVFNYYYFDIRYLYLVSLVTRAVGRLIVYIRRILLYIWDITSIPVKELVRVFLAHHPHLKISMLFMPVTFRTKEQHAFNRMMRQSPSLAKCE